MILKAWHKYQTYTTSKGKKVFQKTIIIPLEDRVVPDYVLKKIGFEEIEWTEAVKSLNINAFTTKRFK